VTVGGGVVEGVRVGKEVEVLVEVAVAIIVVV